MIVPNFGPTPRSTPSLHDVVLERGPDGPCEKIGAHDKATTPIPMVIATARAPRIAGSGALRPGTATRTALAPAAVLAAVLAAVGDATADGTVDDAADEPRGPAGHGTGPVGTSVATAEARALDLRAASAGGSLEFDVPEDAVSALVTLRLAADDHDIGLVRLLGPGGAVLHATTFASESWDARRFASVIAAEPLVGTGGLALFLPTSPRRPIVPGRYRLLFDTDPPQAALSGAELLLRHAPAEGPIDALAHAIDLHLWVAHPDGAVRDAVRLRDLETRWRREIDAMLAPHALAVGTLAVSIADAHDTRRFAVLDDEAEIAAACRAVRRALSPSPRDAWPLHVGVVAEIVAAEDDEDWTSGLAPQPGVVHDDGSPDACVFVAERGALADEPLALDAPDLPATMMANLVHELGHFAGLSHTTEADGLIFDLLDDTPRCALDARDGAAPELSGAPDGIVDEFECDVAGGAANLMFWSGGADFRPYALTPEQAWVLRRHPLFRPLPAAGRAPEKIGAPASD